MFARFRKFKEISDLFIELRAAIHCKKPILIVKDATFEFPEPFPKELSDIHDELTKSPTVIYQLDILDQVVSAIKEQLGPSDEKIKEIEATSKVIYDF